MPPLVAPIVPSVADVPEILTGILKRILRTFVPSWRELCLDFMISPLHNSQIPLLLNIMSESFK